MPPYVRIRGDYKHILESLACFKRHAFHVPNALETIDNEAFRLIIYCFLSVRHMKSATFEPGLTHSITEVLYRLCSHCSSFYSFL
jgi:hypothetical protein